MLTNTIVEISSTRLTTAPRRPAAYEQLRLNEKEGTDVMVLPSQRTLRDYGNYIRPSIGFNHQMVNELATKTRDFS